MSDRGILIGIAGGTGSGKTSVARSLAKAFGDNEVALIEQDSYYYDLSHLPMDEREQVNFDHPDSIDFKSMAGDINELLNGNPIDIPLYDYHTHSRSNEHIHFEGNHIVILEGILGLYDEDLRRMMDIKIFVDTADDIRIIRRMKRDIKKRGRSLDSVIQQYYNTVRPMHIQFVEPSKRYADIIVPEGGHNKVAIDILQTKIQALLEHKKRVNTR